MILNRQFNVVKVSADAGMEMDVSLNHFQCVKYNGTKVIIKP